MAAAPRLLARLGLDGCLALVFGCYTLRFLAYAGLASLEYPLSLARPFQVVVPLLVGAYPPPPPHPSHRRYVGLSQPWWPSLWLVLPAQLLHGVTFGLYWTAGVHWAATSAPDSLAATFQGAFAALRDGGATLALLAGGAALDRVGGEGLYASTAIASACAGLVAVALAATAALERERARGRLLRGVAELSTSSSRRESTAAEC